MSKISSQISETKSISTRLAVAVDKNSCTQLQFEILSKVFGVVKPLELTPVSHLRVAKSEAEVKGMERALVLESNALIAFYANLEAMLLNGICLREHEVP
jgi:Xaa-Pro aminopeptidase